MKKLILLSLLTLSFAAQAGPAKRERVETRPEGRYELDLKREVELLNKKTLTRGEFVTISNRLLERVIESVPAEFNLSSGEIGKIYEIINRFEDMGALKQVMRVAEGLHSEKPAEVREAALTLKLIAITSNSKNRPILVSGHHPGLSAWQVISIAQKVAGLKGIPEYVERFVANYIHYCRLNNDPMTAVQSAYNDTYGQMGRRTRPQMLDISEIIINRDIL